MALTFNTNLTLNDGKILQTNSIKVPTSSDGNTYGFGIDGQILKTNGANVYWGELSAADVGASASNHTHTLSIATDSGTNAITLAASTKYKLTAGDSTYIFTTPPNTTYSIATQSVDGLMSAADKTKLDGIATSANNYTYTHPNAAGNTGSFGPSSNASPAHGETFSVPYITINANGHVTAASTKTITLPGDNNTWRGITNSLSSTDQSISLSAYAGKSLYDAMFAFQTLSRSGNVSSVAVAKSGRIAILYIQGLLSISAGGYYNILNVNFPSGYHAVYSAIDLYPSGKHIRLVDMNSNTPKIYSYDLTINDSNIYLWIPYITG